MRDNTWRGGRRKKVTQTSRVDCLKCGRGFLARSGYGGKRIDHLCDRCKFINSFLGEPEEGLTLRFG